MKQKINLIILLISPCFSSADIGAVEGLKNMLNKMKTNSDSSSLKGKCENLNKDVGPHEILKKVGSDQYLAVVRTCRSINDCSNDDALIVETSQKFNGPTQLANDIWVENMGKDISIKDQNGFERAYPLYKESKSCKEKYSARPNLSSPFVEAMANGNLKKAKELMKSVDPNAMYTNVPILYAASRYGDLEIVRYLIENGAEVDAVDSMNITSLIVASFNGKKDIVRYLISKGANINHKGEGNRTPSSVAIEAKHYEIVKILKAAGAK